VAALLHGTPAAGVSQTLRHGTRNGITELSQRAPPIFGRAAITLGIGPHSSFFYGVLKLGDHCGRSGYPDPVYLRRVRSELDSKLLK